MEKENSKGNGLNAYYEIKINELLRAIEEKQLNIKRLQACRNELNTKGK